MSQEVELKLLIAPEQREKALEVCQSLADANQAKPNKEQFELTNAYFDTSDLRLRQFDIGLRIRSYKDHKEQTIKLAGRVMGGMHQRPEYNVNVDKDKPDLTLFDNEIWPDDFPVYDIQRDLDTLFVTDFTRTQWRLPSGEGVIEMVFDDGYIESGEQREPIAEIELEVQKGSLTEAYRLANELVKKAGARVGSLSKAARGYLLAGKSLLEPFTQMHYVPLKSEYNVGQALYRSLESGLRHWQHNEACLEFQPSVRAVQGMADGIQMVQVVLEQLIENGIGERRLLTNISQIMSKLQWLKRFEGLDELTAEDGAYHRALKRYNKLYESLLNSQEDVIRLTEVSELVHSVSYQRTLLELSEFLFKEEMTEELEQPVLPWSSQLLKSDWQLVQTAFSEHERLNEEGYLKLLTPLQNSLLMGTCFGHLFDPDLREKFRLPWQDLARGIREITALHILHERIKERDDEIDEKLMEWQKVQRESLLKALEYSRKAALKREPYWMN
ncbi:inorganic triphosphatase [Idiomarina abyssalis]|uniref:CYTH domain-containing protein n=1 Tax=Idiomarina abyssalis TaxID=86102 RepID=UPI0006C84565|nr:CYTH domain-containing protein [Idiomarina abyssalis]KPD21647.1 phosphate-binding protein [Idiomarina abyssalis]SFT79320.1 triphosphatase [Idiomarina abyssalis]